MPQSLKTRIEKGPKFFQKYIVLKREKIMRLFTEYMKAIYKTDIDDLKAKQFIQMLDELMNVQGMHYFVVNLDEKEGQAAMVEYWAQKGYSKEEVISCLPEELRTPQSPTKK